MMKTVRVPASSANLGPGFDTLGLALEIYLECRFEPNETLAIEVAGRDAESIATDETNLIWSTIASYGAPPIKLHIENDIPLGKGLGSSAAAITAGVIIANELLGTSWSRDRIFNEAAHRECHPDNVAACVLGGVTASAIDDSGIARAIRLDLPPAIQLAVVVPDFALATSVARAALPDCYSRHDAIFNLQRVALLVAALAKNSPSDFAASLSDRFHQPYREGLVPGLANILALRAPGLFGCVLSGAGPSVLVFFEEGAEDCCRLVTDTFALQGQRATILHAGVDREGFQICT
jgi:homoserine kinase